MKLSNIDTTKVLPTYFDLLPFPDILDNNWRWSTMIAQGQKRRRDDGNSQQEREQLFSCCWEILPRTCTNFCQKICENRVDPDWRNANFQGWKMNGALTSIITTIHSIMAAAADASYYHSKKCLQSSSIFLLHFPSFLSSGISWMEPLNHTKINGPWKK